MIHEKLERFNYTTSYFKQLLTGVRPRSTAIKEDKPANR